MRLINGVFSQSSQLILPNDTQHWLIEYSKHLYDILVLLLTDELRDNPDITHNTICIGDAHRTI